MADTMLKKQLDEETWWQLATPTDTFIARPETTRNLYLSTTDEDTEPTTTEGMPVYKEDTISSDVATLSGKYVWLKGNATIWYSLN